MSRYVTVHASPSARASVSETHSATVVDRDFALVTLSLVPGASLSVVPPSEVLATVARRIASLALATQSEALVEFARRLGYVTRLIVPFPGRVTIRLVDEWNAEITDENGDAITLAVV